MNEIKNKFIELNEIKYIITKISLFLAILIALTFSILRITHTIPPNSIATINVIVLLLFLILMYLILIKYKNKLYFVQFVTYLFIISFLGLQIILAKHNIFIPIWINFSILTAYIVTHKKIAVILS